MGESQNQPFQLSFNRFLRVAFQGSRMFGSMLRMIVALPLPDG